MSGWAGVAAPADSVGAGALGTTDAPQLEQKRLVARLSHPQFGQV